MNAISSTNTVEREVSDATDKLQCIYSEVSALVESDVDEGTYNKKLRALARKYGYKAEWVAYTGSCVAGGMNGKHLHLVSKSRDYCPVANNAAILF